MLVSCKTDQIPTAQPFRIKKVNYKSIYKNDSFIFNYSTNGRIDSITTPTGGRKVFYYDSEGKLEQIESQYKATSYDILYTIGEYITTRRYLYYYLPNGNLGTIYEEQVSERNAFVKFYGEWDLDYDDGAKVPNRVTIISVGPPSSGRAQYSYIYYGYENGNTVRRQAVGGVYTETFQYDDKPNLLKGLVYGSFYSGENFDSYDDLRAFSQNNVLLSNERYTYDANGLLVKATHRDGAYEVTYEYEPY
ncbi:hypothetical protein GCM10028809_32030 [Spirosoma gilvum]